MIVFQMVSPFLEQPICQPIKFLDWSTTMGQSIFQLIRFEHKPQSAYQQAMRNSAFQFGHTKFCFLKWFPTVNTILCIKYSYLDVFNFILYDDSEYDDLFLLKQTTWKQIWRTFVGYFVMVYPKCE